MSDTQIIGASIQVDAGNSIKTVKELREEVKAAREQMEGAAIGSEQFTAAQDRLSKATGLLNDATGKGAGGLKNMAGEVANTIPGFNALEGGALKLLKSLAMLALTPVGLVLTAIAGVIALVKGAMDRSEESTNKIKTAFSAFSGIVNFVLKALEPLGKFLIDGIVFGLELAGKAAQETMKLISGALNFLGFEDAAKAVDEFNEGITESVRVARELAKAEAEHEEAQRKARLTQLQYQKDAERLRQIRDDENLTLAQRIKANDELAAVLRKQLHEELAIAQTALKVANLRIEQEGRTKAALDAQAAALTEIADIEERLTGQESEQLANRVSLQKEYAQKAEDARKEREEKAKAERERLAEFNNNLLQKQQENELLLMKDGHEKELKQLQFRLDEESRANEAALKEGRLKREEYNKLQAEIERGAAIQRQQIQDKHQKEEAAKEKAFQDFVIGFNQSAYEQQRTKLIEHFDQMIAGADEKQKVLLEKLKVEAVTNLDTQENLRKETINKETTLIDVQTTSAPDEEDTPEDRIAKLDAVYQAEREFKEAKFQEDLAKLGTDQEAIRLLTAQHNAALQADEQAHSEAKKAVWTAEKDHRLATLSLIGNAASAATELLGKNTVAGKGLAAATATFDTYLGSQKAFNSQFIPGDPTSLPRAILAASVSVISGLARVKQILSVQVPGKGAGGVSAPAVAPAAPIAPVQTSTRLDASTINNMASANAAAGGVNREPLRAYVVSTDIKNDSDRDARLERAAELGG